MVVVGGVPCGLRAGAFADMPGADDVMALTGSNVADSPEKRQRRRLSSEHDRSSLSPQRTREQRIADRQAMRDAESGSDGDHSDSSISDDSDDESNVRRLHTA